MKLVELYMKLFTTTRAVLHQANLSPKKSQSADFRAKMICEEQGKGGKG